MLRCRNIEGVYFQPGRFPLLYSPLKINICIYTGWKSQKNFKKTKNSHMLSHSNSTHLIFLHIPYSHMYANIIFYRNCWPIGCIYLMSDHSQNNPMKPHDLSLWRTMHFPWASISSSHTTSRESPKRDASTTTDCHKHGTYQRMPLVFLLTDLEYSFAPWNRHLKTQPL